MQTNLQPANGETPVKRRGRGPGRPFPKGKCQNPNGRIDGRRYKELVAELMAELGGDLPPTKRLLVEQLARLKIRSKLDDVRAGDCMLKIAKALGLDHKREPAKPSLDDHISRNYAP